jgi:putative transposase
MSTQAHQEHPDLSIVQLCELVNVNRSWYYARPADRGEQAKDLDLRDAVEQIILDFPGYGYRRVTAALRRAGWQINHKRVQRLMREECLLCQLKRQFVPTTNSQHPYGTYPHLAKGLEVHAPNLLWVADITYIRLPTSFVYLAAILDAYSRKCIGWQLSRRIDTQLALAALEMACASRPLQPGLVHHSDRGVQYASAAYVQRLLDGEARISMSAKGNPDDNAKAESFFKTLKYEEVYLQHYHTFEEAQANLSHFIEEVYTTKRLHSSLGYVPPTEFELAFSPGGTTSL